MLVDRLFQGNNKNDTSVSVNDKDDEELFDYLCSTFATVANKEGAEITCKEADDDTAEDELIAAMDHGCKCTIKCWRRQTVSIRILFKLIVLLIARKIAGGSGEAMMGSRSGDVGEREEEAISGSCSGRGKGSGQAAIASACVLAHLAAGVHARLGQLRGWVST